MRVAVTGAAGFIGQQVVMAALDAGHQVVAVQRHSTPAVSVARDGLEVREANIADAMALAPLLMGCDLVIHLAATLNGHDAHDKTLASTAGLLSAMESASVSRLVLVSSMAVLAYASLKHSATIDEDTPICENDDWLGPYARMKRDQEHICREWSGGKLLILRPGLVHGSESLPGDHAGFVRGGFGLVATHQGEVPLVELGALSRLIVKAAQAEWQNGATLHLIDQPAVHQRDYLMLLRARRRYRLLLPLPWRCYSAVATLVRGGLRLMGRRIPDSFRKNSVAARQRPFVFSSSRVKALLSQL